MDREEASKRSFRGMRRARALSAVARAMARDSSANERVIEANGELAWTSKWYRVESVAARCIRTERRPQHRESCTASSVQRSRESMLFSIYVSVFQDSIFYRLRTDRT